jgi:hypothetical protein
MKDFVFTSTGLVYGGGKHVAWDVLLGLVIVATDSKTADRVQKGIRDRLKYVERARDGYSLDELRNEAIVLGIKVIDVPITEEVKYVKKLRTQIKNKLKKFEGN